MSLTGLVKIQWSDFSHFVAICISILHYYFKRLAYNTENFQTWERDNYIINAITEFTGGTCTLQSRAMYKVRVSQT